MKTVENENTSGLLVAGAKSYSEALAAMNEFCREVQTTWRSCLTADLAELSQAIGIKLEQAEIKNYADPDSLMKPVSGKWAAVGVKIDRRREEGWRHVFYLEWDEGKNYVTPLIAFNESEVASRVFDHLQKAQTKAGPVGLSSKVGVFIQQEISADRMQDFGKAIRTINREWIELWKRAGGLKRAMQ